MGITLNTKRLTESAVMIAIAILLSIIKFHGLWSFGGGVTFGSMVPLILISHRYGLKWGIWTSFTYSLLQIILGIDNVQYASGIGMAILIILLDYIIAYSVLGLSSIFCLKETNRTRIFMGVLFCLGIRYFSHFLSGWAIWDTLWPNQFQMAAPIYSLLYNGSYMIPEILITSILCIVLIPWVSERFPVKGGK